VNKKITKFEQEVYDACSRIPIGRVVTYKDIAVYINKPKSYRAVGNALNNNPFAPAVPCHRVVKSDGSLGGFASGAIKKRNLLQKEGIEIKKGKIVKFNAIRFIFN
jgi:O-6-methylguanine DNA methyltransferase